MTEEAATPVTDAAPQPISEQLEKLRLQLNLQLAQRRQGQQQQQSAPSLWSLSRKQWIGAVLILAVAVAIAIAATCTSAGSSGGSPSLVFPDFPADDFFSAKSEKEQKEVLRTFSNQVYDEVLK
jgi:hypothetical protein